MLRPLLQDASPLERVVARVSSIAPSAFTLSGTVTHVPEHRDPRQQANALVGALAHALYQHAFARELRHALPRIEDQLPDRALVAALRRANAGRNHWERGWFIEPVSSADHFVVRKKRAARFVQPGEFVLEDPHQWPPKSGARVRLRVARESTRLHAAFYFAFGETLPAFGPEFDLVRLYWNVQLEHAPELVRILTMKLNRFRVPFRLKCLTIPAHYDRLDPAVLFVQKRFFPITSQLIADAWPELAPLLSQSTPLFTHRLAPGLSVAENAAGGGSFGRSRCRLLAEGLWDAHVACADSNAARLTCVRERYTSAALCLDQPHLDAGSSASYELPQRRRATLPLHHNGSASWIDVAAAVGALLCRDALWSGNQCTWFGDCYDRVRGKAVLVHRSLGGNVYAGSAGIALFLAELAQVTGVGTFGGVARAGAEHAITSARDTLLRHGIGFYTGLTGVAAAAVRVGELLSDQALIERALALLPMVPGLGAQPNASNVSSGWAGASIGLLDLCARYPNQQITEFALHLADQIVALTAEQTGSPEKLRAGFAHGAAGYAWALAELYVRTNDERFRIAALCFLAWERHVLEEQQQRPARLADPWCTGAAGIALSRARVHQLLSDEESEQEANSALQRCVDVLSEEIRSARGRDYSLCHGVIGCADALLSVDQLRGTTQFTARIHELAATGGKRFAATHAWPSGVRRGENPGLLPGLAGTGHFYLRLSDPAVIPTVLLPGARA